MITTLLPATTSPSREHPRHVAFAQRLAVLASLLVFFALLVSGIDALFFTADEPGHFASGYAYIVTGREAFWLLPEHRAPPLLDVLQGLLVYAGEPGIDVRQLDGWGRSFIEFASSFTKAALPLDRLLFSSRFATIWLAMLLAVLVYRWGRDLHGHTAGFLALLLMMFDPNMLAHARLATGDVGVAALGTASLYAVWRWTRQDCRAWWCALATGALLGLTMLSKLSAQLWIGAAGLFFVAALLRRPRTASTRRQLVAQGVVAFVAAFVTLWAGYGFTWGTPTGLSINVPAPAYWTGLLDTITTSDQRWSFALGLRGFGGWPWYFPVAALLKNTIPLLLLVGAGIVILALRDRRKLILLAVFPGIYGLASIGSGLNIGYRHLLALVPFLYLLAGVGCSLLWTKARPARVLGGAVALLVMWHAIEALGAWPLEITYFNEVIGDPDRAYLYLSDSNLDWGQTSLTTLRDAFDRYPGLIDTSPATRWRPAEGAYLVGASDLQGIGSDAQRLSYEWFRHRTPLEVLDRAVLVYEAPADDLAWFAQCASPAEFLEAPDVLAGLGREVRGLSFDCTKTWVYPGGGDDPGIFALRRELYAEPALRWPELLASDPRPLDPFIARRLAPAPLSFDKPYADELPPYVLHEFDPTLWSHPAFSAFIAAPAGTPPAALGEPSVQSLPAELDNGISFLGAVSTRQGDVLEIETWWRASQGPLDHPLSVMAHLLTVDGAVIGQDDGFGVSPAALQAGDVIVQRHRFTVSGDLTEGVWLRTGIYWSDSMERWRIGATGNDAIFIPVS